MPNVVERLAEDQTAKVMRKHRKSSYRDSKYVKSNPKPTIAPTIVPVAMAVAIIQSGVRFVFFP